MVKVPIVMLVLELLVELVVVLDVVLVVLVTVTALGPTIVGTFELYR
jgi:hypothetical protein